jgi:hypothetical protein
MTSRIFLANVGANASHPFASPIFEDGSFEVLPIPEAVNLPGGSLVRYGMLRSFNHPEQDLRVYLPRRWWDWACHADPEFHTNTYGDDCDTAPRGAALKSMEPGDHIFFIARLVLQANGGAGSRPGQPGFYLIGYLEVAQVLASVRQPPGAREMAVFGNNAHVRRALADTGRWDSFWVFKGSAASRRFQRAVPVTQDLAQAVFRDAAGAPWRWDRGRSVLQTIGSYTRSCRCVIDPRQPGGAWRAARLWRAVAEANGLEAVPPELRSGRQEQDAALGQGRGENNDSALFPASESALGRPPPGIPAPG